MADEIMLWMQSLHGEEAVRKLREALERTEDPIQRLRLQQGILDAEDTRREPSRASSPSRTPRRRALPASIEVSAGRRTVVLGRLVSKSGNPWYTNVSTGSSKHLPGGVRVVPDPDGMPEQIVVARHPLSVDSVPIYDDDGCHTGGYHTRDQKVGFDGDIEIGPVPWRVTGRLTVRKDLLWNLTVRVFPAQAAQALSMGDHHLPNGSATVPAPQDTGMDVKRTPERRPLMSPQVARELLSRHFGEEDLR